MLKIATFTAHRTTNTRECVVTVYDHWDGFDLQKLTVNYLAHDDTPVEEVFTTAEHALARAQEICTNILTGVSD